MMFSCVTRFFITFCTEYMQSHAEWTSRMIQEGRKVGRRQKTTQYQKATHFELGSDEKWYNSVVYVSRVTMKMYS